MRACASAKLILSGEHSVVYGQPALVCPIPLKACAQAMPSTQWTLHLLDLNQQATFSAQQLSQQLTSTRRNYQAFLDHQLPIASVCPTPMDLWASLLASAIEAFELRQPVALTLRSEIPVGAGLGSSAALIMASLKVLSKLRPAKTSIKDLLRHGLEIENLQHGHSSGLDLAASVSKDCLLYTKGRTPQPLEKIHLTRDFQLIDTGCPETSTGECVSHVAQYSPAPNWQAFGEITQSFCQALERQDAAAIHAAIRQNHQLLVSIGVVPKHIQTLITQLEGIGLSAKICGAGSCEGEKAGVLLIYNPMKLDFSTQLAQNPDCHLLELKP